MLIKDYMTKHPLMVEPTMSIVEAQRLMGENNIRHIPVTGKGKRLLGLLTRQALLLHPAKLGSLNVWEISRFLSKLTVGEVMVKDVITVGKDATLEDAARIMVENKIGCLPVLDEGIVVGIITEIDLLAQLMDIMATRVPGVRVMMRMPNKIGELTKLVTAISAQGWGLLACGGVLSPKDPTKWDAVVKIRNMSKGEIVAVLENVEGQEILDVRET